PGGSYPLLHQKRGQPANARIPTSCARCVRRALGLAAPLGRLTPSYLSAVQAAVCCAHAEVLHAASVVGMHASPHMPASPLSRHAPQSPVGAPFMSKAAVPSRFCIEPSVALCLQRAAAPDMPRQ